ncbi:MAG: fibronectin type III domain-containing protein [Prevotella sp.]|nr:fibronectin type III domain-containing protein [Prevotella sp.]
MKKTLLLICAFIVSMGVWAQPTAVPTPPTITANKVRTVFSATYGNAVGLAGAANTKETLDDNNVVIKATGSPQYSIPFAPFCVNDMEYLHYDIWANAETTVAFSMYCTSTNWIGKQETLVAGWNSISIPLSYFKDAPYNKNLSGNITELNLCKSLANALDGFNNFSGTEEFYIANIYFYTESGVRYDAPTLTATATDITQTSLNLNLNATKSSLATTDAITYTISWNNGANTITPNPTGTSGTAKVVAVDGLTANTNYTFHIVATDDHGDYVEKDVNVKTLQPDGIAPTTVTVPTYNSENVIPIYGSHYENPIYNQLNAASQTTFDVDNGTKQVWKLNHFTNANIHFPDNYTAPTYDELIIDVYSEHDATICIYPLIWANDGAGTNKGVEFNLTENTWKHCVINVQELLARTNKVSSEGVRFYQIQFTGRLVNQVSDVNSSDGFADADGNNNIYIGNVYFYKEPSFTLTASSGTNTLILGGATTNITTTVTKSGNDVTSSATITYESSNSDVVSVSNSGVVTATGLGSATVTVSATYGETTKTHDIIFTVTPSADDEPTDAAANVLSIYSDKYTSSSTATPSTVGKYNGASWDTIEETTLGVSDHVYHATNSTGFGFGVSQNITDYITINVSIFPSADVTGHFYIEGVNGGNKTINFTLKGGQWNKITNDITAITGTNSYTYFILDNAVTQLYVDNFYFKKLGEGEVITIVNGNSADVLGDLTASNVNTVISNAGSAAIINLRNVTISEPVTINPTNQNAVIVVNGDGTGSGRTPDTNGLNVTANNIVVFGSSESVASKYYRAKNGVTINLVDDNASQPAYNFVIDTQADGFTYTRTVAADKWVSYNSPATVTIPEGVSVYKATDATSSSVTFTKQENQNLGANVPVILHNNTNDAIVITSNIMNNDLNLTANPGGAAINGTSIMQYGTARLIEADGTQFALQNNDLKRFNTGAKIGAFRVYFTGLSSANARAIFIDGETTKIGSINANGEINVEDGVVYNLAGQRVQNPTKGIYIINGKKVVLK